MSENPDPTAPVYIDPNSGGAPQPGGFAQHSQEEPEEVTPTDLLIDPKADPIAQHDLETQAAGDAAGKGLPSESDTLDPGDDSEPMDEAPSGNASRAEWADYAVRNGATEEEVAHDGLKRDELRDKYGPTY